MHIWYQFSQHLQVLTPFENNGHLTDEQRNYNRRLSKVRCRIEHTFGRMQVLWRRLQFFPVVNLDFALDHMVAVVVLHNFRIINGEEVPLVSYLDFILLACRVGYLNDDIDDLNFCFMYDVV